MTPEQIQYLQSNVGLFVFKIGFLVILFMVAIFLLIVLKQIRSMNQLIHQPDLFPYLEAYLVFLECGVVILFIVGLVIL